MRFIDANVFIRFLLNDDPVKGAASRDLLLRIRDGAEEAVTSETAIAEIFFVLTSARTYRMAPAALCDRVRPILALEGLKLANKRVCLRALDTYSSHPHLGYEDALALAYVEMQHLDGIYSYDRGIDRVPGVHRIEPAVV